MSRKSDAPGFDRVLGPADDARLAGERCTLGVGHAIHGVPSSGVFRGSGLRA
jgi:hypothetical protein